MVALKDIAHDAPGASDGVQELLNTETPQVLTNTGSIVAEIPYAIAGEVLVIVKGVLPKTDIEKLVQGVAPINAPPQPGIGEWFPGFIEI